MGAVTNDGYCENRVAKSADKFASFWLKFYGHITILLQGKSRIYMTLDEIGGSKDYISYQKLQQEYLNANQVALDRTVLIIDP